MAKLDPRYLGVRLIAAARFATWERRLARAMHDALAQRQEETLRLLRSSMRPALVASVPPDPFGIDTWSTTVDEALEPVGAEIFGVIERDVARFFTRLAGEKANLPPIDLRHRLDRMLGHMVGLGQETSDRLGRTLTEGVNLGEGIDKLADRVQRAFDSSQARAEAIARTETVSASNGGFHDMGEAINAAGITVEKRWIATHDERTRPTHVEADGQKVPMESSFIVGGCELRYPADPNSMCASEVVSCRCFHVLEEPGSEEGE